MNAWLIAAPILVAEAVVLYRLLVKYEGQIVAAMDRWVERVKAREQPPARPPKEGEG